MSQIIKWCFFTMIFLNSPHALASEVTGEFQGKWAGIEVMGCDRNTANTIRNILPLKKGDAFSSNDSNTYKKWCDTVRKEVKNHEVKCSFIGYSGGNFYFDVDVQDKAENNTFRVIPTSLKNNIKIESELLKLFNDFDKLIWTLPPKGIFPAENFDKGYIDYDLPELHAFTKPLAVLAHAHNQNLLDVIQYSSDPKLRGKAATLLSWSQSPKNIEHALDNDLLNDPDSGVRNNLARSLSFFLVEIKDPLVLQKAVSAFCKQAKLHSHGDRNKALHSIKKIVQNNPEMLNSVNVDCMKTIEYIAEMSILDNVGGFAKDILENIDMVEQ
jgi:hypothetical protein